jgi:hypothetical protein
LKLADAAIESLQRSRPSQNAKWEYSTTTSAKRPGFL